MFLGQDLVRWEDLPLPGMILIPKVIPTQVREEEFRMVDGNAVLRPRLARPLVRAT
jgi:hypothetical protein